MATALYNRTKRLEVLKKRMLDIDLQMADLITIRERALSEYVNLKHNKDKYLILQEEQLLDDIKSGKLKVIDAATDRELDIALFED